MVRAYFRGKNTLFFYALPDITLQKCFPEKWSFLLDGIPCNDRKHLYTSQSPAIRINRNVWRISEYLFFRHKYLKNMKMRFVLVSPFKVQCSTVQWGTSMGTILVDEPPVNIVKVNEQFFTEYFFCKMGNEIFRLGIFGKWFLQYVRFLWSEIDYGKRKCYTKYPCTTNNHKYTEWYLHYWLEPNFLC